MRAVLLKLALPALFLLAAASAQGYDVDTLRAIEIASEHPVIAASLQQNRGYTSDAYDAQDRYGLWRVDFTNVYGDVFAWAQVHLAEQRIVAWEADAGLTDAEYAEAEEKLLAFLRYDPEFLAFGGDIDEHFWTWVGYESWRDTWVVHVERGTDSLVVTLRSENAWQRSLDDLSILQIRSTGLVGVSDWRSMRGSDAIALAFTDPRIVSAVRGREGWTASAQELDRSLWHVVFMWEGQSLAEVEVDLAVGTLSIAD
ncbi:MAG: hypothetical protein KF813_08275 [Trueperaceae bacterium]|nr:hypothetical protein [Trueperaceae bacterium]